MLKKEVVITGMPLEPLRPGYPAVIREAEGYRRTTPVLWVDQLFPTEATFETQNTIYHLRVVAVPKREEACRA